TTFFGSHPGGDAFLSKYCGTDATQAYDTKNLGPGQAHSGDAQAILAQYLIQ
ncbi:cytochrome B5, partial [Candidatus Roizmanbacteria bacterium CG_4_10_14_0_8_um_filter_39_9]